MWRQSAIALVLVGGGFVLGAASLAAAHGDMGGMGGWHHHHHGPKVGMIQHMVHGALDNVGATTAQEDKVHDIIAAAYTQLDTKGDAKGAMKTQVLELMKAPTLDRAAFDKLRADKVAEMRCQVEDDRERPVRRGQPAVAGTAHEARPERPGADGPPRLGRLASPRRDGP